MRRALHQLLRIRGPAEQLAEAERIERTYLGTVLRLTLLAPDIVEAILDGRQSCDLTLPVLLGSVPSVWDEQRSTMAEASGRVGKSAS
jgi:hypothetical protein